MLCNCILLYISLCNIIWIFLHVRFQKHVTIMCMLCTHVWTILCIWPLKEEYHNCLKVHSNRRHTGATMQRHIVRCQLEQWRPFEKLSWSLYHFMEVVCQWWSRRWIQCCSCVTNTSLKVTLACIHNLGCSTTSFMGSAWVLLKTFSIAVLPFPWNWDCLQCGSHPRSVVG